MKARGPEDGAYVLRLDRGERIVETLAAFCAREGVRSGSFTGLGTCRGPELGFFDENSMSYRQRKLEGNFEITALIGNVSVKDGRPFVHAHITLGDPEFRAWAGHLQEAETAATCEIVLVLLPGALPRKHRPDSGLNLLEP